MWEGSTNTHSCPCITMYMCNTLRWGSQYHTQHTKLCLILRYLEYEKVIVNLLSMALIIIKGFFFRIQFNKIIFFLQKLHVVNDIATYIDINILHCFVYSKEFFFSQLLLM